MDKTIQNAMMHLTSKAGVRSVAGFVDVPNLLVVDYELFPHAVDVLVGVDGLYIPAFEVQELGESLPVYEIKEALTLLDIKILDVEIKEYAKLLIHSHFLR